jgi:predicted neuraminidase
VTLQEKTHCPHDTRAGILPYGLILLISSITLILPAEIGAAQSKSPAAAPKSGKPPVSSVSEFIFNPDHRPTPQCHASTIAELPDGTLVAAWFGGSREGAQDVGIWLSRRIQGSWTAPAEVATGMQPPLPGPTTALQPLMPCWNPVIFQPRGGPLILFYKVGPSPSDWWGMMTASDDGGKSWSAGRRLPPGILGPIKNKPVQLGDGTLLCGSSTEDQSWRIHFEQTSNLGRTWSRTEAINDGRTIGAIQPTLLIHPGGKLQALGRSRQGRIWEAWSSDGGRTWSNFALTSLPNPNSGIDAVTLRDGRHLLVYNNSENARTPLNVAISKDGRAWTMIRTLEDAPGEYSYPAVIQSADGLVHITYTWKRETIKHVAFGLPQD